METARNKKLLDEKSGQERTPLRVDVFEAER